MEPSQQPQERKRAEPRGQRLPIRELDSRGRKLVELMLFGADPDEAEAHGLPANTPLPLEQAAPIAGLKMRNARFIFSQKAFMAAYGEGLKQLRRSHQARAVGTLAQIMDDEGDGTAATKTVRLKAANSLLDNPEARAPNLNVNVGIAAQLTAGIVVRLPSGISPPPLETNQPAPTVIEQRPLDLEARAIPAPILPDIADDEAYE